MLSDICLRSLGKIFTTLSPMNIISQLVQFIFLKREVKDIDYSPAFASLFFLLNTVFIVAWAYGINHADIAEQTQRGIKSMPYGMVITVSICFAALYYGLFAAKQKESRFVQASTAYFGSSVILGFASGIASLVPSGILIMIIAQGLSFACSIRATMQSLDYSVLRALFSLIGITLMAIAVGAVLFPPEIIDAS